MLDCEDRGLVPFDPAVNRDDQASGCRFTYWISSRKKPGQIYHGHVILEWAGKVDVYNGGNFVELGTETYKSDIPFDVRVEEQQAIITCVGSKLSDCPFRSG